MPFGEMKNPSVYTPSKPTVQPYGYSKLLEALIIAKGFADKYAGTKIDQWTKAKKGDKLQYDRLCELCAQIMGDA